MLYWIIGLFIVFLLVGAVADGLLSEKAKEDKRIRYLLNALPSPYNLMRLYARVGDNLDDFTRAHAVSGLGYLGIMLIVMAFAWRADQQVLYGIEYVATRSEADAFWQSVGIATIIQAMLVFNGGMAMKLKINGMLDDNHHKIQFRIHTLLGIIALASTVYLSFQTDKIATANGLRATATAKGEKEAETDSLGAKYAGQVMKLTSRYSADSLAAAKIFTAEVNTAYEAFKTDSLRKEQAFQLTPTTKVRKYANARITAYRKRYVNLKSKALTVLNTSLDSLDKIYKPQIAELETAKTGALLALGGKLAAVEKATAEDVDFNADATRGRNLILNLIALFFNLGFQFFIRGANQTEKEKRLANVDNENETGSNVDGAGGSTAGGTIDPKAPTKVTPPPVTPKTPPKTNIKITSNISPKTGTVKGGTIEANKELVTGNTPKGEAVVLYRGTKREEWWNWSQLRTALKNRVNKYNKAKSDDSRNTQLAWIRLFEEKMEYIESQGGGKAVRSTFNPKTPEDGLFS